MKQFILPFRLGKKQKRAVLDSNGYEVVIFPKGCEYLALNFVESINNDLKDYSPADIAMKYKLPIGSITCPHCGVTCNGLIKRICPMCDKDYFINELK